MLIDEYCGQGQYCPDHEGDHEDRKEGSHRKYHGPVVAFRLLEVHAFLRMVALLEPLSALTLVPFGHRVKSRNASGCTHARGYTTYV